MVISNLELSVGHATLNHVRFADCCRSCGIMREGWYKEKSSVSTRLDVLPFNVDSHISVGSSLLVKETKSVSLKVHDKRSLKIGFRPDSRARSSGFYYCKVFTCNSI